MLYRIRRFFRRVGHRIGEAGFHHFLVALVFSAPAALVALEAWAGLALWWTGYYWSREDGFEQVRPWGEPYRGGGRLTDAVFVFVYALFAVLVTVLS